MDTANNTLVIGTGTTIEAELSADEIFTPSTIDGAQSNITNASASITSDGYAKFVSASIGGWDVNTTSIVDSNNRLKLEPAGDYPLS